MPGARGGTRGALAALSLAALFLLSAPVASTRAEGVRPGGANASIIGGQPASIASFPWLAYIDFSNGRGGGFACTGAVVSPRLVLTAGHCVENLESGGIYPAAGYTVLTGATNLSEAGPANASAVARVLVNPGFKPSRVRGDAGLLQLAAPISAPAIPLADPAGGPPIEAGTTILIAGWGLTTPAGRRGPDSLYAGEAVVQSASVCAAKSRFFYPYFSPASQFCTLDSPSSPSRTCHGDSGGPAIARREDGSLVEIGITSLGEESCRARNPSVFTRVDRVSDWVKQWIAALESGGPPPAVVVPVVRPPFLSVFGAKSLAYIALLEAFHHRFKRGKAKRIACRRVEREKVKCWVSWYQGPNDYYGSITIYLTVSRSEVVWGDRFKIHWVNDRCWFRSGHRRTCRTHTVRR
jgi:trypsin